jgi:hypothetical protein
VRAERGPCDAASDFIGTAPPGERDMATLLTCRACRGFTPARAAKCPHCGAALTSSALMRGLFVLAGTGLAAATLMACYGTPPCDHNADGGSGRCFDTNQNSGDAGTTDAGTADAGR